MDKMMERRGFLKLFGASTVAAAVAPQLITGEQVAGKIIVTDKMPSAPEVGDFTIMGDERKVWTGDRWEDPVNETRGEAIVTAEGAGWVVYPGWLRWRGGFYCHVCFADRIGQENGVGAWWVKPNRENGDVICQVCGREIERWGNHITAMRNF